RVTALYGVIHDDLPVGLGKRLELATALVKLLEQRSQTVYSRTGTAGRLDAAALYDQQDSFLFQPPYGLAYIGRVKSFFGMQILNRQSLSGSSRTSGGRNDALDGRLALVVPLSDRRHRHDGSDRFFVDVQQRLCEQPLDGHAQL